MNCKKLGDSGENMVALILEQKGYEVIARNFRTKFGEIDIVTIRGGLVSFWEVKTRVGCSQGHPAEAVDERKQRRIKICSEIFLNSHKLEYKEVEFNVAAIEIGLIIGCI